MIAETAIPPVASPAAPAAEPKVRSRRYCLVTPARDEGEFAARTLESVVKQTLPPALWVIVDDGSKDNMPQIVAEYAARHPYIRVIRREDRGHRKVGPGVIDAFYAGLDTVDMDEFEYVCKFDLDLEMPPAYFETLVSRMEADPRIGTCSGKPYFVDTATGKMVSEKCGDEMSVGMTKFYRTDCFREIGGFVREVMWDGIDCHKCRMLGWSAVSWDDPQIRFTHLRPMGSSQASIWTGRQRHGYGQYYMGTDPLYMAVSCAYRLGHPPVVFGAMATMWGYLKSWLKGMPRYNDLEFRKFLRKFQWDAMLKGKRRATQLAEQRGARRPAKA